VDFGFHLRSVALGPTAAAEKICALVDTGEVEGFHSVWCPDHIVIPTRFTSVYPYGPPGSFTPASQETYYDPTATLAFIAGRTRRLRVGTSVLVVPYRNPLTVAKWAASLDQLSGGRLLLGVGSGWFAEEFAQLGQPHFAERGRLTDEYIQTWKALWTQKEARFEGRLYRFGPVVAGPKPLQQPHPPIYAGGNTRAALRRAAELCDGWHPVALGPDEVARGIETMRALAERAGRDPDALAVSVRVVIEFAARPAPPGQPGWHMVGDTAAIVAACERYRALGVRLLIVHLPAEMPIEQQQATLTRIAREVAPAFAGR
jgi:probable F420-dependent oxidoreductase